MDRFDKAKVNVMISTWNKFNVRLLILVAILSSYAVTYAEQTDIVCSDNLIVQGAIKMGENSNDLELKRRSLELKKACAEELRARQKVLESKEDVEIWKEVDKVRLPDKDMYQEVLERSVKELRMHPYDVGKMMDKDDPKIRSIFHKMIKEIKQKIFNEIKAKRIAQKKQQTKNSNKNPDKSGKANAK